MYDDGQVVPTGELGAGPHPTGADPRVAQSIATLSPMELDMLRQSMTPELGMVLAKLLGPGAMKALEPFMIAPDMERAQAQMMQAPPGMMGGEMPPGGGGGMPPMPSGPPMPPGPQGQPMPQSGLGRVFAG